MTTFSKFVNVLTQHIDEKFDPHLYYIFAIYDVLPFEPRYLKQFAESTPDFTKRPTGNEMLTGQKELRNYHLDQYIGLCYKYGVPFTKENRVLSARANDPVYYEWLMNLDGFNYEKFDVYWIVEETSLFYLQAYKASKALMSEIPKALAKKYIKGPAKVYFNSLLQS